MLVEVATAEDDEDVQSLQTLAERIGTSSRELLGGMIELNNHWRGAWTTEDNPPLLLVVQQIGSDEDSLEERTALRMAPLMVGPVLDASGRGRRRRDDRTESL